MENPSGVLVINKPSGMTSHDVVHRVRRTLKTKRVGHAGTLDPDATGVLVVCVGEATRVLEYATAFSKEYEAQVVFGAATDTDDASGKIVAQSDATNLSQDLVQSVLPIFRGTISQQVPAYSAVHINGKRAYELARAGEVFELPTRRVDIHVLELISYTPGTAPTAWIKVACSKGTYIRSLCRDIGRELGVAAHMGSLKRTKSGFFAISDAVGLSDWEQSSDPSAFLLPMLSVVSLSQLELDGGQVERLAQGQRVWTDSVMSASTFEQNLLAVTQAGELAAIVAVIERAQDKWLLQPKKVFWKKDR